MDGKTLSALRNTVAEVIEQGRLGTPQFLRCIARAGDSKQLDSSLNELLALGEVWFGSRPVQRYRLGEDSGIYVTEMVKWPQGQGAVLTVSSAPSGDSKRLDLMLVGSKGTLYHEQ